MMNSSPPATCVVGVAAVATVGLTPQATRVKAVATANSSFFTSVLHCNAWLIGDDAIVRKLGLDRTHDGREQDLLEVVAIGTVAR
jgi:hypothetical protein